MYLSHFEYMILVGGDHGYQRLESPSLTNMQNRANLYESITTPYVLALTCLHVAL